MNFDGKTFGYKVELIQNHEEDEAFVVVFGKNNNAEKIDISFCGKSYSEVIKPDELFLVVYPEYKKLKEDTDIYNIYEQQDSNDLKIEFLNSDGEINKEMKILK